MEIDDKPEKIGGKTKRKIFHSGYIPGFTPFFRPLKKCVFEHKYGLIYLEEDKSDKRQDGN